MHQPKKWNSGYYFTVPLASHMRILVVSNYFPPHVRGGFEISASIICRSLVERGHEVDVLATQDPPAPEDRSDRFAVYRILEDRYSIEGIKRYHPRLHGWAAVNAEFRNGPINRRIVERFLVGRTYDVAMLFNMYRVGTSLVHALAKNSIPTIWSLGDYWHIFRHEVGAKGYLAKLNRQLWSRRCVSSEISAPFVYATYNSDHLKRAYENAGFVAHRSWVVHRSCPVQHGLSPYSYETRNDTFVITSQIARHKGIHIALSALSILHKEGFPRPIKLTIYGSGDDHYIAELHKFIELHGLGSFVSFPGRCPHDEVLNAVKSSLALIHPAIWDEPFGRVAIEAMACNTPLISADTGAIFEIADQSSALIYPKEDPNALAAAMRAIASDEDLGKRLAASGMEAYKHRFTPTIECERIEGILKEIAISSAR